MQNSGDSEKHVILRGWEMRRTKATLRAMKTALYDTDNGGHMSLIQLTIMYLLRIPQFYGQNNNKKTTKILSKQKRSNEVILCCSDLTHQVTAQLLKVTAACETDKGTQ